MRKDISKYRDMTLSYEWRLVININIPQLLTLMKNNTQLKLDSNF